jgi:hypothetical protein
MLLRSGSSSGRGAFIVRQVTGPRRIGCSGTWNNAFKANATGVLVHLTAVDLKVFNGRFSDQLFKCDSIGMREKNWTGHNWKSIQCARTSQSITQYTRITTRTVIPHANATRSAVCARPSSLRSSLTATADRVAMDRTHHYPNLRREHALP